MWRRAISWPRSLPRRIDDRTGWACPSLAPQKREWPWAHLSSYAPAIVPQFARAVKCSRELSNPANLDPPPGVAASFRALDTFLTSGELLVSGSVAMPSSLAASFGRLGRDP